MMNSVTSPLDHSLETQHIFDAECLPTDGLHTIDGQQGGDDAWEPLPTTCPGTASNRARHLVGGPGLLSVSRSTDRMTTSSEVQRQHIDPEHSSEELSQRESNGSASPSDQSSVECQDWKYFAARRVDIPLLLDILLARKHRDNIVKDFLLNLPTSILKKYEVFSRQNPLFVCLDIIK